MSRDTEGNYLENSAYCVNAHRGFHFVMCEDLSTVTIGYKKNFCPSADLSFLSKIAPALLKTLSRYLVDNSDTLYQILAWRARG